MTTDRHIVFDPVAVSDGRIAAIATERPADDSEQRTISISFELSEPLRPHNDLVALALSTLCGRRYKSIHFGLPVSDRVVDGIGRFSLAAVTAAGNTRTTTTTGSTAAMTETWSRRPWASGCAARSMGRSRPSSMRWSS